MLLVGGFLGAGKTTLLQKLIRHPRAGRLAVLVNELGALGLDGELLREAREGASLRSVQLDSGCLCCTLRGELGQALLELARPVLGEPPDEIVVELSGAALASEVHFQVATLALAAPYYADGLVCLVDACLAPRWHREADELFRDQLTRADLVLLTKLDLASADERAATEALVAELAPAARVAACTRGEVDPALLLGGLRGEAPAATRRGHVHTLRGETIPFAAPVEREALEGVLEALAPELFRIKGLVDLRAQPGSAPCPFWVQCVGDQIDLVPAGGVAADAPRRLIFIGPAPDRRRIEALLAAAR